MTRCLATALLAATTWATQPHTLVGGGGARGGSAGAGAGDAEGKVGLIIVWRVLGVGSWSQFGKWLLWLLAALGLIETVQ